MKTKNMKERIMELMPTQRCNAATTDYLTGHTGLSVRELKSGISELRMEYPICSQLTDGGGYWLAENWEQAKEFIAVMEARRAGLDKTISVFRDHYASMLWEDCIGGK